MPVNLTSSVVKDNVEKWNDIIFYSCIAAILGLAIFFRSQGYFDGNISFWWDEADWAHKLLTKPLKEVIRIRPVGYMLLTRFLVGTFGTAETIFRLISYISSILVIPVIFLIAKRLWNSRIVILLLVFLAAFNPNLITFAKEFKPYALDFFVHACMVFLTLVYIDSKKNNILYAILILSIFSIFFCYNIVFIFPAIFLILLFDAYSKNNTRRLTILISTALVIFLILSLMYKFIWSNMSFSGQEQYWGNKYDVFFLRPNLLEHFKWFVSKYVGLVKDSSRAEIFWPGVSFFKPVTGLFLLFFQASGVLGFLLEKKYDFLILFLLPILTVILVNSLGMWPFGPFRVNLFLMLYFLVPTVNGFNFFIKKNNKILKNGFLCVLVFFFVLQLPINLQYYEIKPRNTWVDAQSDVRKELEIIIKLESARKAQGYVNRQTVRIHADNHAYFATQFYLTHHPNAGGYTEALQELNVKYSYVLSGVESFQPEGAGSIIDKLEYLSKNPGIYGEVVWYVLGNREAIDKIEPIIASMPERVLYKKKFSYASLIFLLRT